ncbi:MAG: response regulator [Burkholderiaceae bacterium]
MPDSDDSPAQASGTVLYIEDQAANVVLVEGLLAELPGVALITAGTGAEGIRLARSERPDLVLLDMHLPDFGGLEVIRALSLEISLGLKVALLTGDAFTMDVIKAMSLGAYDYWVKPIAPHRLIDGVRRALLGKPARAYPPLEGAGMG